MKAEQTLVFSATEIAADQIKREGDHQREYWEAVEALPKLLLPDFAQLPAGSGHRCPAPDERRGPCRLRPAPRRPRP
jgi:hypothetical protein